MALLETITSWNDGVTAYLAGHYTESLKNFSEIPDPSARILFNISCALLQLNRLQDAQKNLDYCVQKDPHLAIGHYHKGIQNLKLQRYGEADADFDNALQRMRGCMFIDYTQLGMISKLFNFQIYFAKAVVLVRKGKIREAIKMLIDASQDTDEDEFKRKAVQAIHALKMEQSVDPDEVPVTCIFHPPKNLIANLKKREYVGKSQVIASYEKGEKSSIPVQSNKQNRIPPPPNRAPPSAPMRPAKSAEDLRSTALILPIPRQNPRFRKHSADPDDVTSRPKGNKPQRPPPPFTISNESAYQPLLLTAKSMDSMYDPDFYKDEVPSTGGSNSKGRQVIENELTKVLATKFGDSEIEKKPEIRHRGNINKSDVKSVNGSSPVSPPPLPKRNPPPRDSILNNPLPPVPSHGDSSETSSRRPPPPVPSHSDSIETNSRRLPPPGYLPPPPPKARNPKALK